jgi:glycosyltransferase involved in cell wall biosynthesis
MRPDRAIPEAALRDALIVSLSNTYWGDVWRSRQHVMSRLARDSPVLFISPAPSLGEALRASGGVSRYRRPGHHAAAPNLRVLVPVPILRRYRPIAAVFKRIQCLQIERAVRRCANGRPIVLYLWHPDYEEFIDRLAPDVVCFHLHDELSMYNERTDAGPDPELLRVLGRADLVFTSSEALADRYRALNNVHWIPNGVDFAAYERQTGRGEPDPVDIAGIPRPRLGYIGSLRPQIDLPLLLEVARARPTYSLVFIGDVARPTQATPEYQALAKLANVHFLDSKRPEQLPAYLRALDVGLLPYRLDGAARYVYPLKMLEYLAAGLPVVSTRVPAVLEFSEVIRIASAPAEWITALDEEAKALNPEGAVRRRAVAARNTWDERVGRISAKIAGGLLRPRKTGN